MSLVCRATLDDQPHKIQANISKRHAQTGKGKENEIVKLYIALAYIITNYCWNITDRDLIYNGDVRIFSIKFSHAWLVIIKI